MSLVTTVINIRTPYDQDILLVKRLSAFQQPLELVNTTQPPIEYIIFLEYILV